MTPGAREGVAIPDGTAPATAAANARHRAGGFQVL